MTASSSARLTALLLLLGVVAAGCQAAPADGSAAAQRSSDRRTVAAPAPGAASGATAAGTAPTGRNSAPTGAVSLGSLPLGDGRVSTTATARGSVLACRVGTARGGAQASGAWLHASSGTWSYTAKPHVQGQVSWPQASTSNTVTGSVRTITTTGVSAQHPTGAFPIATDDPSYAFDRNPNAIAARLMTFTPPAAPVVLDRPQCLPGGAIGVLNDGVVLFNALDADSRDAVAHEVQDRCDGHPERSGSYHAHWASDCVTGGPASDAAIGWALDGYPITGAVEPKTGKVLGTADLDVCHGISSTYRLEGELRSGYHYVATRTYPYTLGCFHAKPSLPTGGGRTAAPTTPGPSGPRTAPPPTGPTDARPPLPAPGPPAAGTCPVRLTPQGQCPGPRR